MHPGFLRGFAAEEEDHHLHADARVQLFAPSRAWFSTAEAGTVASNHLNMPSSNPRGCSKLARPLH